MTIESAAPALNFTDAAAQKVKTLIDEEGNPNLHLRVSVVGGGCSGFQYVFVFDDTINDDDYVFNKLNVNLLVDAISIQYLGNAEVDYRESIKGEEFVIRNPNAKTTCGCGSSFAT